MRAGLVLAAAVVSACGYVPGLGPTVEIPAGLDHRMSVGQVEGTIRAAVAIDAAALRREIRPFRLLSIRLVAPFERVRTSAADTAPSTMSVSTDTTTWVVRAEGTFRDCASTCSTYWSAVVVVDDSRGHIVGRHAAGPMTLDQADR